MSSFESELIRRVVTLRMPRGYIQNLLTLAESLADFAHKLVMWFEMNQRPLPWRETTVPYRILVSETMLQQTRVETVIPYYFRFLERFPNESALANAAEPDVLKLWEGLGYYSRARNLQKAMRVVIDEYGGAIPDDATAIRGLPGVGPYTTGALMSIAFNRPLAAVDGNVLRVMSRYLGISDCVDDASVKKDITEVVQQAVETSVPRLFTQALMELGATVCLPRHPQCLACPVRDGCCAAEQGQTDILPRKRPKKARRQVTIVALWLEHQGQLVVQQRRDEGLLASMWQLPCVELPKAVVDGDECQEIARTRLRELLTGNTDIEKTSQASLAVREGVANDLTDFVVLTEAKHLFTHLEWHVVVVRPVDYHTQTFSEALSENVRLVPIDELQNLAWPKVYTTILGNVLTLGI